MIHILIHPYDLQVRMEDNAASKALIQRLQKGDIQLELKEYAHMEKFACLDQKYPCHDQKITTEPGDVMMSEGNLLVIYYASNTWKFTRLGKIVNVSESQLKEILGQGNVPATLSLDQKEKV